jgi:hypothetical protein
MNGTPVSAPQQKQKQKQKQKQTADSGERPARGTCRFREHTLGPDRRPEAVPVTFTRYCGTCGATGPTAETGEDGMTWAVVQLKDHPAHRDHREVVTRRECVMAEPKEPCSHRHLDPDTKKCKDCGNQIYPPPDNDK